MSAKLRFFFLGSLGLVVLALAWLIIRAELSHDTPDVSGGRSSVEASPSVEPKAPATKAPESAQAKVAPSAAPSVAPAPADPEKDAIVSKHTYIEPTETIYLEQSPAQKDVLRVIDFISTMKFPAPEEPEFIGVNDQGFDQYEYKARDGSYVKQWKRSGEIAVEEVTLENGDKIIRRAPEADSPNSQVSFENKADKTYKSVSYRPDGSVSSIYVENGPGGGTTYYYDQQGRLTGKRTWEAEKK